MIYLEYTWHIPDREFNNNKYKLNKITDANLMKTFVVKYILMATGAHD